MEVSVVDVSGVVLAGITSEFFFEELRYPVIVLHVGYWGCRQWSFLLLLAFFLFLKDQGQLFVKLSFFFALNCETCSVILAANPNWLTFTCFSLCRTSRAVWVLTSSVFLDFCDSLVFQAICSVSFHLVAFFLYEYPLSWNVFRASFMSYSLSVNRAGLSKANL